MTGLSSRASCNSLVASEIGKCLLLVEAGEMRRLFLMGFLRPTMELALRVFAALLLSPVFDGRAISSPGSGGTSYRVKPQFWKGGDSQELPFANWPGSIDTWSKRVSSHPGLRPRHSRK